MKNTNKMSTKVIVLCAIMTALVLLLQLMGASIRFGQFSISLVLIPIVVGTATCGVWAGAWLGLVFGLAVLMSGDAAAFLAVNVPGTILTVLAKGIACGAFSGLVYKLLEKHNRYAAVIAAAVVCPLVNTGVFLLGCLLFFMEPVSVWAAEAGLGADVGRYMIFFMVGANFIFEFLLNVFVSPVIVRLINIRNKQY